MQEQQPSRKPRTPLTKEELFYVIETKKLKEQQKIATFKASTFYIVINRINIVLAAFLSYAVLSILFFSVWSLDTITASKATYGEYHSETQSREITLLELNLTQNGIVNVNTVNLNEVPEANSTIFIGKDYLLNKLLKVKLPTNDSVFLCDTSYAILTICCFALVIGFLVYLGNRHLTYNGLLTTLGLFTLASLYFIWV